MITLIYIAVVGSLMVSYTKARAEGLGLECKTGLLARPERVVILAIGLLSGTSIWAVALLAIFSQGTAIERIVYVWRITSRTMQTNETDVGASLVGTLSGGHPLPGGLADQPGGLVNITSSERGDGKSRPYVSDVLTTAKDTSADSRQVPTTKMGMNEGA